MCPMSHSYQYPSRNPCPRLPDTEVCGFAPPQTCFCVAFSRGDNLEQRPRGRGIPLKTAHLLALLCAPVISIDWLKRSYLGWSQGTVPLGTETLLPQANPMSDCRVASWRAWWPGQEGEKWAVQGLQALQRPHGKEVQDFQVVPGPSPIVRGG